MKMVGWEGIFEFWILNIRKYWMIPVTRNLIVFAYDDDEQ